MLTAVLYTSWLQGFDWLWWQTVIGAVVAGLTVLGIVQAFHLVKRGLEWARGQKPLRADRQQLVVRARNGVDLYHKPLMPDQLWVLEQDYQNWRGIIIGILEEKFPEKDEADFKESCTKVLPLPDKVFAITPEQQNVKRQFRRDLDVLEKIIHRHTPFLLPKPWYTPWH